MPSSTSAACLTSQSRADGASTLKSYDDCIGRLSFAHFAGCQHVGRDSDLLNPLVWADVAEIHHRNTVIRAIRNKLHQVIDRPIVSGCARRRSPQHGRAIVAPSDDGRVVLRDLFSEPSPCAADTLYAISDQGSPSPDPVAVGSSNPTNIRSSGDSECGPMFDGI